MTGTAPRPLLAGAAFLLFLVWSNSFVAIAFLLGAEREAARMDWIGLTVGRFLMVLPVTAVFVAWPHRVRTLLVVRRHPVRLLVCSVLAVPAYNLALFFAQQHGVPAPVASLTTALLPLFVMVLAAVFLGESLTRRRVAGFLVSVTGMLIVATARGNGDTGAYGSLIAVAAMAPLSWSLFSILSKPVQREVPPLVWTYLCVTVGTVMVLPLLPGTAWSQILALDTPGWVALLYLSYPCTVFGYAVWTWLLKHLPASTVGLSVFMNPPLTTVSKLVLAAVAPGVFAFSVVRGELVGGLVALAGLAIAVTPWRKRIKPPPG